MVDPARYVQDRAPVAPQPPVAALPHAAADLAEQAVTLPWRHCDVAGERPEEVDVPLGLVNDLPMEPSEPDVREEEAGLALGAVVGQLLRPRPRAAGRPPLADLVIDRLELAEEGIPAFGEDVDRRPERKMSAGPQERPCLRVARARVDPVPGRRRGDEVERLADRRSPGFERGCDDVDRLLRCQDASSRLGEPRPQLD